MSMRLFSWALTSALAGFLFGFDTVVISGAEKTIQELWGLSDTMHGFAIGSALWGMVIGSLIGGFPSDIFGRKKTLLVIGGLFILSSVWCAFAPNVYHLIIARFLGGLGIGISTVAAPLYISEISPAKNRGLLTGMFQFNIVFGILVAFLSNYLLNSIGENAWRWMLGVMVFPSILYTVMCLTIPESPRWLLARRNNLDEGVRVLKLINPSATEGEINQIVSEIQANSSNSILAERFDFARLRKPILLAFLVAFFNQLSGINAILYFAPRIFELSKLEKESALLQSAGIGVTNLIFTFVGLWLIDKLGRRTLLYIGSFGYILSLGLCAWAFDSENFKIVPYCIFAFIAAHAIGQGAVIWVFISEIFPNKFRAFGQTLGASTHWLFAALLATVFPTLVKQFQTSVVFGFFCFMMILHLLWVMFMVPETRGVPLEQMEKKLGIRP